MAAMRERANPVRGVLREELASALRKLASFERALRAQPRGALVEKRIRGRSFFYLAHREGRKVRFEYKGKMKPEEVERLQEAKKLKARYRGILADLRHQIAYLKRALHERKVGPA